MKTVVKNIESFGKVEYVVTIETGRSITVQKMSRGTSKTFKIGDTAEYDSYNLSYTGVITSITEKTVTIRPRSATRQRRLSIDSFSWRNWNFDAERIARENSETMMYI